MTKTGTKKSGKNTSAIRILPITTKQLGTWLKQSNADIRNWVKTSGFGAKAGELCMIPDRNGRLQKILAGIDEPVEIWSLAHLPTKLPPGRYRLEAKFTKGAKGKKEVEKILLGWKLGSYSYSEFKSKKPEKTASLETTQNFNAAAVNRVASAVNMARDLINSPANRMTPQQLAAVAKKLAEKYKAKCSVISGESLLKHNYPAIYTVGKASDNPPRLVDIKWGNPKHPKITLVGKGITFDSGGLDIKPSSNMRLMKKDMGGAACVLALADMIMSAKLPVRLRLLLPIAENSIAGNSYRPSDIISTRKGINVEVGNTDAEGRLILCDALAEADREKPELLIDMATLTGASRVALGTDIPSFFTADDKLAADMEKSALSTGDPLWRLPLWQGYREILNSKVADINSAPAYSYAGAITAALFLREFVENTHSWVHIDLMAWNLKDRVGRPAGGEAQGIRALFALLQSRYTKK